MIILCISLVPSKIVKMVEYGAVSAPMGACMTPWYQHGFSTGGPRGMTVSVRLAALFVPHFRGGAVDEQHGVDRLQAPAWRCAGSGRLAASCDRSSSFSRGPRRPYLASFLL
jgi:hypothetical protein